ncbi:hypothetical protein D3C86_1542470 [compost metagenome]
MYQPPGRLKMPNGWTVKPCTAGRLLCPAKECCHWINAPINRAGVGSTITAATPACHFPVPKLASVAVGMVSNGPTPTCTPVCLSRNISNRLMSPSPVSYVPSDRGRVLNGAVTRRICGTPTKPRGRIGSVPRSRKSLVWASLPNKRGV